ncbi:hypothetical protein GF373_17020 [bacterium]|nr:hypothetical protein [bacterium]
MNLEILKNDIRKLFIYYSVFLFLLFVYAVYITHPLAGVDVYLIVFAIVQGVILSWRIFREFDGSEAFLFSRAVSRQSLFWHRWLLGMGLQALTWFVVAMVMVSGLRELVQMRLGNPFFPMVRWYELHVMATPAIVSFLTWQLGMYGMVRYRSTFSLVKVVILLFFLLLLIALTSLSIHAFGVTNDMYSIIIAYIVAVGLGTTFAVRAYYLTFEIL